MTNGTKEIRSVRSLSRAADTWGVMGGGGSGQSGVPNGRPQRRLPSDDCSACARLSGSSGEAAAPGQDAGTPESPNGTERRCRPADVRQRTPEMPRARGARIQARAQVRAL